MTRISTVTVGFMVYKRCVNLCAWVLVPMLLAGSLVAQTDKNKVIAAHYKQAETALEHGQGDKAVQEFRQILKLDPANAEAYANLGVIAYKSGEFAQAKQLFADALKHSPALWDAKAFLGLCQIHTGDRKEGIALIEQSFPHISNSDLRVDAGVALIQAHEESKTLDQVTDVVRELERTSPHNQEVLYVSYRVYSELAAQALSTLSQEAPDSARVHQILGEAALTQQDLSGAVAQFTEAVKADPGLPGIHYQLGHAMMMNSSSPEEVQREFEAAIVADPTDYRSEYELGESLRLAGKPELAEKHYTAALRLNSDFSDAQVGLGILLLDAGKPAEAIEHLTAATRLDPNNETAHYRLSRAYRAVGRVQESDRELLQFQKLHKASGSEHPATSSPASNGNKNP